MIRVFIADDHALFRVGLRFLLEQASDIEVVGEAGSGRDTVSACHDLRPHLVLLDIDMPDIDGIEVTQRLLDQDPGIKILILTMYENEEYASRALKAGAHGYAVKGIDPDDLPHAIRRVMQGKTYITKAIAEDIAFRTHHTGRENPISVLSDRELQVITRIAGGNNNREVAESLCLSPRTVETYKRRAMEKLGLKNIQALVRFAMDQDLLK